MYFCAVTRNVYHRRECLSTLISVQSVFLRRASISSRHPFPFPLCSNPTPHEIFHLPRSASQDEIKTRYYELVKVYHPDATHFQHDVPHPVRNSRFRAITQAYGVLRGRSSFKSDGGMSAWDYRDEVIRAELRRRARRSRSSSSSTATAADGVRLDNANDSEVWYTLLAFVLVGIIASMGSMNSHLDHVERHTQSAAANLAQARAEAQVHGMERRRKIRELVRSFHDVGETGDGSWHPEMHDRSKACQDRPLRADGPRKHIESGAGIRADGI